jgi:hypothetical protein
MLTDCLLDIANLLDVNIDEMDMGQPLFTDPRYEARPFDVRNFRGFDPSSMSIREEASGRRMAFVDGGNLEVLRAPNFSVQLVRVYFNIFEGPKRILPKKVPMRIEFFVTALTSFQDGKIYYSGILVPLQEEYLDHLPSGEHLMVDSMDKNIRRGSFGADISVVGSITRRFAEWLVTAHVMRDELREGDIIWRDGTLQTAVKNERYYAQEAFKAADEKGVVLGGVAKTSTLFTTTGLSLLAAVHRLSREDGGEDGCWYYHPLAENNHPDHPAEMFITKLHPSSRYVFRTEVYKPQARAMGQEGLDTLFNMLGRASGDLSFLGYPYGLVDADQFARVGMHESRWIKDLINNTFSGLECYDKIARHLMATNAHDVLDSI